MFKIQDHTRGKAPKCNRALDVLISAAALALSLSCGQAQALDCRKATSRVDLAICAEPGVKRLDDAMSAAYFRALRESAGEIRATLLRDQRRWLAVRNEDCGSPAETKQEIGECIGDADQARSAAFGGFAKTVEAEIAFDSRAARGSTGGPFAGDWSQCFLRSDGNLACGGKKLFQNETRVCGFWSYGASGATYEGRLIGEADGDRVIVKAICGRPGSDAKHECPEWDATKKVLRRCEGSPPFLTEGDVSCERARAHRTHFLRFPNDPQSPVVDIAEEDRHHETPLQEAATWVASCLRDPALPNTIPRN